MTTELRASEALAVGKTSVRSVSVLMSSMLALMTTSKPGVGLDPGEDRARVGERKRHLRAVGLAVGPGLREFESTALRLLSAMTATVASAGGAAGAALADGTAGRGGATTSPFTGVAGRAWPDRRLRRRGGLGVETDCSENKGQQDEEGFHLEGG